MIGQQCKTAPVDVLVKFLHCIDYRQCFFLDLTVILFGFSQRTGSLSQSFSERFRKMWVSTAPISKLRRLLQQLPAIRGCNVL